jgi:predicted Rossmann fold flavoprotein
MKTVDVIIVGGGAAGLMCAIAAGQRRRRVLVLEGSNRIGKKILMSGGGRCNFTNLHIDPSTYISHNPHFCKSALSRHTQWDFIALVEKHGIAYHEKTLGQLFCNDSSRQIVDMLAAECTEAGVEILTECKDIEIAANDGYSVKCSLGEFRCDSLVVATGGLSIPKMGATDFGYRVARQFGLRVFDTAAGLVPFTLTGTLQEMSERLSGLSCRATVTAGQMSFTESILFTHRGLSGPAMLQASSYWAPGAAITIDLFPGEDAAELLLAAKRTRPKSLLCGVISERLPKALVTELQALFWSGHADTPLGELSDDTLRQTGAGLQGWVVKPAATEGYRTAEVTLGGVDTDELSSRTMECRKQPGLYFVGEVVDVTGHLGGFNFQWAWSSGWAAGQAV